MKRSRWLRAFSLVVLSALAAISGGAGALLAVCGPFTDVSDPMFCPFVLEVFYLGITTGTTPTTYDPASNVTRLQMAAFLSRTVDGTLKRGSRRAALGQFWSHSLKESLALTIVGDYPEYSNSDGLDVWVSHVNGVSRVRASDGSLLGTWTGSCDPRGVLPAMGRVFVAGSDCSVGKLYAIDPSQPGLSLSEVVSGLGSRARGIAFDGDRIWTANDLPFGSGSVSIITPGPTIPWTVTTITSGFRTPFGMVFDGAHVWVTDYSAGTLLRLDRDGSILQTVTIGANAWPSAPAFDGENIWVPNAAAFTTGVVRASTGALLMNLPGNGQNFPSFAAFDGERVLVSGFRHLSLWKAADLTPLGFVPFPAGESPRGVCSDGLNFWIPLWTSGGGRLARF